MILDALSGFAIKLVALSFGCLYPAFETINGVKRGNKRDIIAWQYYWVVFAGYRFFELLADITLNWLPYYEILKCGFILWLLPNVGGGSNVIHIWYVSPGYKNTKFPYHNYMRKTLRYVLETLCDIFKIFHCDGTLDEIAPYTVQRKRNIDIMDAQQMAINDLLSHSNSSRNQLSSDEVEADDYQPNLEAAIVTPGTKESRFLDSYDFDDFDDDEIFGPCGNAQVSARTDMQEKDSFGDAKSSLIKPLEEHCNIIDDAVTDEHDC